MEWGISVYGLDKTSHYKMDSNINDVISTVIATGILTSINVY